MEKENEFLRWASNQMGYDEDDARHIFSKLRQGCGEELWAHIVKYTRNIRQRNAVAASSILLGTQPQKKDGSDSEDLKLLHQNKCKLESELSRLEKDADDMIRKVSEKEVEVESLHRHYGFHRHKSFLLNEYCKLNKTVYEHYAELEKNVNKYYNEIEAKRKCMASSQLFLLGESSPLRDTPVYQNIVRKIERNSKHLLNRSEVRNKETRSAARQTQYNLEIKVDNTTMGDILQSVNFHAKSTVDALDSHKFVTGDGEFDMQASEKEVVAAKKRLEEKFQDARDRYIACYFEIQERQRNIREYDDKIKDALKEYDSHLERVYGTDGEALELKRSIVRLELKCCLQKEMVASFREMLEEIEKMEKSKESRDLPVMSQEIFTSEEAILRKYSTALDAFRHNKELMSNIESQKSKFSSCHSSLITKYKDEVKPLFLAIEDQFTAEINIFEQLEIDKLLVTELGEKQVRVFDLSVHNRNRFRDTKVVSTAVRLQPFHAIETHLPKVYSCLLNANENAAWNETWNILEKNVEEGILKWEAHNKSYSEHLQQKRQEEQNLISSVTKCIARANAAISMCRNIEENISSCCNWNPQTSLQRVFGERSLHSEKN